MATLQVSTTWNGEPLKPDEIIDLEFFIDGNKFIIFVDAPFYGDKSPSGAIGSTDKLWEYEVVELFLLGEDSQYLEIEVGPHGHYLVLQLKGIRQIVRKDLPIEYRTEILGDRWRGVAGVPISYLAPKVNRVNAYSIHGEGESRCYLAAYPGTGSAPDFHQLNAFGAIELQELHTSSRSRCWRGFDACP